MMLAVIKRIPTPDEIEDRLREAYILRQWILFLAAPGRDTRDASGVLDLGEVGPVNECKVSRMTPYSPAEVSP